jgi:hypothetical protein
MLDENDEHPKTIVHNVAAMQMLLMPVSTATS